MMSDSRSRVIPGMSCVSARRLPARRLKSVDLPTFGRPTMTIFLRLVAISFSCGATRGGRASARRMLQCHTWHRTLTPRVDCVVAAFRTPISAASSAPSAMSTRSTSRCRAIRASTASSANCKTAPRSVPRCETGINVDAEGVTDGRQYGVTRSLMYFFVGYTPRGTEPHTGGTGHEDYPLDWHRRSRGQVDHRAFQRKRGEAGSGVRTGARRSRVSEADQVL